jgi:hypothetical protein
VTSAQANLLNMTSTFVSPATAWSNLLHILVRPLYAWRGPRRTLSAIYKTRLASPAAGNVSDEMTALIKGFTDTSKIPFTQAARAATPPNDVIKYTFPIIADIRAATPSLDIIKPPIVVAASTNSYYLGHKDR